MSSHDNHITSGDILILISKLGVEEALEGVSTLLLSDTSYKKIQQQRSEKYSEKIQILSAYW
jgi:hypothetical protein